MADTTTFEDQMHEAFTSVINVALDAISKYVEEKTGETITVEELRKVISKPTDKSVSVVISTPKKKKEIPPEKRCCKPINSARSNRDVCGNQISREGGIFCANCRKQSTLATQAAHILKERGLTLWEATAGAQGAKNEGKKSKRYEASNDDSDEEEENSVEEEEEEEEEEKTPPKRVVRSIPNSRLINAASQKKRIAKKQ